MEEFEMKIQSLFYSFSAILGDYNSESSKELEISDKESRQAFETIDNKKTNVLNNEKDSVATIVNIIKSIIQHRYQNFETIEQFKSLFHLPQCSLIPSTILVKKKWLSDNELELANGLSKWYYTQENLLLISSCEFEILQNSGIVEKCDNNFQRNEPTNFPRIYSFFSKVYTENNLKRYNLKSSGDDYVLWEHNSSLLNILLQKGKEIDSSMVALNVNEGNHWIFFLAVDFYKFKEEKDIEANNVRVYYFNSYNNCQEALATINYTDESDQIKFSAICRLLKLILLFRRYQKVDKDSFIIVDKKSLKIKQALYDRMETMEDSLVHVKVTCQTDVHTCGLHIIRFFDEVLRIKKKLHLAKRFDQKNFEMEIINSKQLKLHNDINNILKSELLEYFLNVNYTIGILCNSLKTSLFHERENIERISADIDIGAEFEKWKRNEGTNFRKLRKTPKGIETKRGKIYIAINEEVTRCLHQLDKVEGDQYCQCNTSFPMREINNLKSKEIDDIHDLDWNVVNKLRWKCSRMKRTSKGASYGKYSISQSNPFFEMRNISDIIQIWKPQTNIDFKYKDNDVYYWYKEILLNRLSFRCNLSEIIIPDGGSCCDWLMAAILLNESNESKFGRYLNKLRKLKKITTYNFSTNSDKVLQNLRLSYAESLSYDYNPNIQELFNTDTEYASENELYCSSVLWNVYNIVKLQYKEFDTFILQDCVRKFTALSPSQIGKFACMYGTEDFLHWFQCVFNIRIFAINIQYFHQAKISSTTCSFINDYAYNSGDKTYDEECKNDRYFDLSNKQNIIPYGIAIILMEGGHFDRIFKIYSSKSPIIPTGSDEITFLLPLLKISETLWKSLDIEEIERHNSEVIKSNQNDANNELNFWFDHHYATEKIREERKSLYELKESEFIKTVKSENPEINFSSVVPCCGIRFPPSFVAYYVYFLVTKEEEPLRDLVTNAEAFAINLDEKVFDENEKEFDEKYIKLLKDFIMKQQRKHGRIEDIFSKVSIMNAISDTVKIYKNRLYDGMILLHNVINSPKKSVGDECWTKRIQFPRTKDLISMKTNDKSSNQNRTDKQIISTQTSKGKRAENTGNNNTDLNILSNQLPKKQKTESSNNVFHNKGTSTIEKTKRPIVTKTVLQGENSKKRKHDSKIIVSTLSDSTPKTSTQKNISTSDVKLTNSTQNITFDGNNKSEKPTSDDKTISDEQTTKFTSKNTSERKSTTFSDKTTSNVNTTTSTQTSTTNGMNDDSLQNNSSEEKATISTQKNTIDGNLTTIDKKNTSDERDTENIQTSSINGGQNDLPNSEMIPNSNTFDPVSNSTGFNNESPKEPRDASSDGLTNESSESSTEIAETITSKNNIPPIQNGLGDDTTAKEFPLSTENVRLDRNSMEDDNASSASPGVNPAELVTMNDNSDAADGSVAVSSISDQSNEIKAEKVMTSTSGNEKIATQSNLNVPSRGKQLKIRKESDDDRTRSVYDGSSSSSESGDETSSLVSEGDNDVKQVESRKHEWNHKDYLKLNNVTYGVCASFSKHPIRIEQLDHFKFTQTGKVANGAANDFKKLILCSKKVWTTGKMINDTYEGMYGFIGQKQYPLVKKYSTVEPDDNFPYIWQCLKTTTSGEYSKDNSLAYLKGSVENSQVLTKLSLIAWDFLHSYCSKNNHIAWCREINQFISNKYKFLDEEDLQIKYESERKSHKLIGNTPFTSCYVCNWMNMNEKVDIIRSNEDAIACVLLSFTGSDVNRVDSPAVKVRTGDTWSHPVKLESENLFIFSPKKCKWKFSGIPKNYLLLSFFIDISTVENINTLFKSQACVQNGGDWYSICCTKSSRESQIDRVPSGRRRNRKGLLRSCASVSMGYIDLCTRQKQEGTIRSCLQDAFINAGFIFGINISKQLYDQVPPKRTKNTLLGDITASPVIKENFIFKRSQHFTTKKGGNEWVLLRHHLGTGVYIVWCTVESKKNVKESHAFVYNSDFSEWNGKKYFGAIIDNREHSYYRAFSLDDLIDIQSARNSLSSYFCGITRVHGWLNIEERSK